MRSGWCFAVALLAVAGQALGAHRQDDWRGVATEADRARLRGWREAWVSALGSAREQGGGDAIAREGALLDPDRALADPLPPPGAYRCRWIKLGMRMGGRGMRPQPPVACAVGTDGSATSFRVIDGTQRAAGAMCPDRPTRGVFLGTLALGDERRGMAYGRDANRDMIGVVERVGDRRWRIVLPWPRFESALDVIELTPA